MLRSKKKQLTTECQKRYRDIRVGSVALWNSFSSTGFGLSRVGSIFIIQRKETPKDKNSTTRNFIIVGGMSATFGTDTSSSSSSSRTRLTSSEPAADQDLCSAAGHRTDVLSESVGRTTTRQNWKAYVLDRRA